MRIDVGQIVAGGEVLEPAGDAVRVHVVTVVLGKDIAGMQPSVTVCKLEAELLPFVLPEEIHGFSWQRQISDVTCLCAFFKHTLALGGYQGAVNL